MFPIIRLAKATAVSVFLAIGLLATAGSPATAREQGVYFDASGRCELNSAQKSVECLRDLSKFADRDRRALYYNRLFKTTDQTTKLGMIDDENTYVATREKICDAESQSQRIEIMKKLTYLKCYYKSTLQKITEQIAEDEDTPRPSVAQNEPSPAAWGCWAQNNNETIGRAWNFSDEQTAAQSAVAICQQDGLPCVLKDCAMGVQTKEQADMLWGKMTGPIRLYAAPRMTYSVKADVSGGVLNLRDGPGVNTHILVALPAGASGIEITGQCVDLGKPYAAAWCPVKWQGHEGWLSACCITN